MANIVLRVTPEVLERKAGEFDGIIQKIEASFNRIESISSKTRAYWRGSAGEKDREGYVSYKDDIRFVLGRLKEHPTDLLSMAGIYRGAESDVKGKNAALKTDVIV